MFDDHEDLDTPPDATILWRHLDLPKLLWTLEHRAVWFARLDKLEDPYEGLPTQPLIEELWNIPEDLEDDERAHRLYVARHNTRVFSEAPLGLYVSCWHAADVESAAMWRMYSGAGEGIAIRTTLSHLRQAFPEQNPTVYGGMVRYVDYETYRPKTLNLFDWATLKRRSFQHEREFRLVVLSGSRKPGLAIKVVPEEVALEIHVSPTSPPWYPDLIERTCARFDLKAPVTRSQLLEHPAYLRERE